MKITHLVKKNGKFLILLLLIAISYTGAITRGASLLWVTSAMLSSILLTSIIFPTFMLKKMKITRTAPAKAEEGEKIKLKITISNNSRLPCLLMEVWDNVPFLSLIEPVLTGMVVGIKANKSYTFETAITCEKRGLYRLGPVELRSGFPLGIANAIHKNADSLHTLIIYPEILHLQNIPLQGSRSQIHRGSLMLQDKHGSSEFSSLREYQYGDNPKYIHWPSTAKKNDLVIKEFDPLASASACLVIDLNTSFNIGTGKHSTTEYSIKLCASIAAYLHKNNMPCRIIYADNTIRYTDALSNPRHFNNLLDTMAIMEANSKIDYSKLIETTRSTCTPGDNVYIFMASNITDTPETIAAAHILKASGFHVFAFIFDSESFTDKNKNQHDTEIVQHTQKMPFPTVTLRKYDDLSFALRADA